jgi:flagellar hook-associated protein 2
MGMRISGLATGIDTESIIADLMKAQRIPIDRLKQKKQTIEWQQEIYREMNRKLTEYRDKKLSPYRLEGIFKARTIQVSGNTAAVSAKATANIIDAPLKIEVISLASAASNHSSSAITTDASFDPSKTLASQADKLAGNISGELKFKINGTTITVDPSKESLNDVIAKINKETNVTAFYDEYSGKISFSAKENGWVNGANRNQDKITFEDVTGTFLSDTVKVSTNSPEAKGGSQAEVVINGLSTKRNTNTFTINGIEITLNAPSGGNPTTLEPVSDTDKILESIKAFIEDYNTILGDLQAKISEERYRDYQPLTDEQREQLSEKQIEKWEERAKSGLLRNDEILSRAIRAMRNAIVNPVKTGYEGYQSITELGIETGDYFEGGKLYITDEEKLREAIETNPDAVMALFSADGAEDGSGRGIAEQIYDIVNQAVDQITVKAGFGSMISDSTLGRQLYALNREIDKKTDQMNEIEDRYYKQFTAMERAIQQMNVQSMFLASQFGFGQAK